ncbi:MAG: alpha/beta hydrolase [Pseudomonadota bacterium]
MKQTTHVNGYSFSYIESGQGAPVVFIHGSLLDYRYWSREVATFSRHFRAIAFSRRHHYPVVPPDTFSYTAQAHIDDTIAVIHHLCDEPVHVVGHSYGGYIATAVACRAPKLLRTLTLIEPGGPVEGQAAGVSMIDGLSHGAQLVAQGNAANGVACFMDTVCGKPKWIDGSYEYQAMTLSNANTIVEQVRETRATLLASELSTIACPVLLMLGSQTQSPFPETLDQLEMLIPHAQRATIANASHLVNIDNHEACTKALEPFLLNH